MHKRHLLHITYFLNFFLGFYAFSILYINSSVLANAWGERSVGIIFTIASLVAIGVLSIAPRMLKGVGDVRWSVMLMSAGVVSSVGLAVAHNPWAIAGLFIIHTACLRALLVDMDVFLESTSENDESGVVRGTFLTIANTALILSPLLVGLLLGTTEAYGRVYFFSAAILLPAIFLLTFSFKHFRDPVYVATPLFATLRKVLARPAVARITYIDFTLRFFYAWMVIYTPLYLHNHLHIAWSEIGVIFTIMLVPFALFEIPLGSLADKVYGEKEILLAGLALMGVSTIALFFIHSPSFIIWTAALLLTRIGGAAVEIMSETYFFKQVTEHDADLIRLFRAIEPGAYVIASFIASIVLFIVPLSYLFPILGLVVLSAIPVAVKLHDTL